MPKKFSKHEIAEMIRLGNVSLLRDLVWNGHIKIPQDLINLNRGDTALHVAARHGQVEMMQFLVTGLKYPGEVMADGKVEEKLFGLDPTIKNGKGKTALDLVRNYGNSLNNIAPGRRKTANMRSNLMTQFLQILELPPESPSRKQALKSAEMQAIPEGVTPKIKENVKEPWGNSNTYTGSRDASGQVRDSAALYIQIRQQYEEIRKERMAKLEEKNGVKRAFLDKAKNGVLTEQDLKEFLDGGGKINCLSGRGGDSAMHLAIAGGHEKVVDLLLKGVEIKVNGEVKTARLGFDDKAVDMIEDCLAKDPTNQARINIRNKAMQPSAVVVPVAGGPLVNPPQLGVDGP